ncbi:hypothetical protein [Salinarimonas sp.]|uniref:hypothetical protein n=1 Tax=Salinarimonas sp. TaxID=2766526 RepID=UPI0032D997E0
MTSSRTIASALSLVAGTILAGSPPLAAAETGAAPARIGLAIEPDPAQAGRPATLALEITDPERRPLDLLTHHARKAHVVIVGADMATFGHIHPEDFVPEDVAPAGAAVLDDGTARLRFAFPHGGRYLVAVDVATDEGPHGETFVVDVEGESRGRSRTDADEPRLAVVEAQGGDAYTGVVALDDTARRDGYAVSVTGPELVGAGEPTVFSWRFERDGAPLTALRTFLDAPLHLALVAEDLSRFMHEHGEVPDAAGSVHGHGHEAGRHDEHGHAGSHGASAKSFGPEIQARLTFPEPGRYVVFAQAAHGENLLVVRSRVHVR